MKADRVGQVVEYLFSKHKGSEFNPQYCQNKIVFVIFISPLKTFLYASTSGACLDS
jgi:hypothetical protein